MNAADRRHLIASLAMLESDQDGEAAAAAHVVARIVKRAGLDWEVIIPPASEPKRGNPLPTAADMMARRYAVVAKNSARTKAAWAAKRERESVQPVT